MKQAIFTYLSVTLFSLLTASSLLAQPALLANDQCARLLASTSYRLIVGIPAPNGGTPETTKSFQLKKEKLEKEFLRMLAGERVPAAKEIRRVRKWVIQLHELGSQNRVFHFGSKPSAMFVGNLSLAQGYLDCAIRLASSSNEQRSK